MAKPIEKMKPEEILAASKKLFFGGFALLPMLWVYNILYVWPIRNRADLSPQVRHCKVTRHFFVRQSKKDCCMIQLFLLGLVGTRRPTWIE